MTFLSKNMSKYRSRKVVIDGLTFDSTKEGNRYRVLKQMEGAGLIQGLQTQVRYELIPSQKRKGMKAERAVHYIADFVYKDSNGDMVVEDVKGMKTKEYILKRKMMLYLQGIQIKEV